MNNLPHIETIPDLHFERFDIYNNDAYKQIEHFAQAGLKVDHYYAIEFTIFDLSGTKT